MSDDSRTTLNNLLSEHRLLEDDRELEKCLVQFRLNDREYLCGRIKGHSGLHGEMLIWK